jgi:hypothetical protein
MIDTANNTAVADEISRLTRAIRQSPASTTGSAIAGTYPALTHQPIAAALAGDNVLVSPPGGTLQIMELVIWNTITQTLVFADGTGPAAQRLFRLTNFPGSSGYTLGYTGEPHMEISPGNPFSLNLSLGGTVDGYVRYTSR